MNNFWTVAVDADGRVFLENESAHGTRFYLEGDFATQDTRVLFASEIARKINGTFVG
jgi:hypothetical protein